MAKIVYYKLDTLFLKQYAAAQKSADEAKKWSIIGIISGVVIYVIYLAVYGLTFFTAFAGNN